MLAESEKERVAEAASLYSREQCLDLIEYLLETILLHVMRSHFRLPVELWVR